VLYRREVFVTESQSSLEDLVALGVSRRRIVSIPPGVDSELFSPGNRATVPRIIYFAGMRRYKRPQHVIEVASRLRSRLDDFEVLIVGEGPMVFTLKSMIKKFSLQNYCKMLGRLDEMELAQLLRTCWVNLHCSLSEGWGYSVTEAAACGVPTAAYSVPGIRDSVSNGVSGILVRNNSIKDLTDAVEILVRRSREFSEPCRAWALPFSWERAAAEWEKLCLTIASPKDGRGWTHGGTNAA
jgi:glycosyltransferase involved in cell wall biosynthesis